MCGFQSNPSSTFGQKTFGYVAAVFCDTDTCNALICRVPIVLHACIDRMHRPTVCSCTVRRITE